MGQYHRLVNLDRCEFIDPHQMGSGLKLWEQMANHPSPATALVFLCAAPDQRGGGDIQELESAVTAMGRVDVVVNGLVGRWHGDRIAWIGDYAEDSDLPEDRWPVVKSRQIPPSEIYDLCFGDDGTGFTNITPAVCKMIERELGGKFTGEGWRDWVPNA